jgi:hypothetical protein
MGWVRCGKNRSYYYRAFKRNGRVFTRYLGRGPEAEQAAHEDTRRRQERDTQRQDLRAARESWKDVDGTARAASDHIQILLKAALGAIRSPLPLIVGERTLVPTPKRTACRSG